MVLKKLEDALLSQALSKVTTSKELQNIKASATRKWSTVLALSSKAGLAYRILLMLAGLNALYLRSAALMSL